MTPGQHTTHQPLNEQKGSYTALPDRFIRQPAGPGGRGSLRDDPAGHKCMCFNKYSHLLGIVCVGQNLRHGGNIINK